MNYTAIVILSYSRTTWVLFVRLEAKDASFSLFKDNSTSTIFYLQRSTNIFLFFWHEAASFQQLKTRFIQNGATIFQSLTLFPSRKSLITSVSKLFVLFFNIVLTSSDLCEHQNSSLVLIQHLRQCITC